MRELIIDILSVAMSCKRCAVRDETRETYLSTLGVSGLFRRSW